MFKKNDPLQNRIRRGSILRLLHMAWMGEATPPDEPLHLSESVLTTTMEQLKMLPSTAELKTDLRYLEEKRAIEVKWSRDGTGAFEWVKLCAHGIDLVEENLADPGIVFGGRR